MAMTSKTNDSASPSEGLLGDCRFTKSVLPSVTITTEGIGATTELAEGNVEGRTISKARGQKGNVTEGIGATTALAGGNVEGGIISKARCQKGNVTEVIGATTKLAEGNVEGGTISKARGQMGNAHATRETHRQKANQRITSPAAPEVAEQGNNDEELDYGNVDSVMQLMKKVRQGNGSAAASSKCRRVNEWGKESPVMQVTKRTSNRLKRKVGSITQCCTVITAYDVVTNEVEDNENDDMAEQRNDGTNDSVNQPSVAPGIAVQSLEIPIRKDILGE
jgi:hypothetical protein